MNSAISQRILFAALFSLAVMAVGCGGGGGDAQSEIGTAPPEAFSLPGDGDLPGWSRTTEPEAYGADDLWEYINGQADFFVEYGFVQVDTAEYQDDETSGSAVLEVYRMGRPQEAFGIFAAERTQEDRSAEIGAGAYVGTNVLGFWQEKYYVKLTSFEEGSEVEGLLLSLAEEISARLPGGGGDLEQLSLFPDEGRVEASDRFIPRNFLAQAYLTDTYRADYIIDGEPVQVFFMETSSPEEAQSRFDQFAEFQGSREQGSVTLDTAQDPPMLIVDGVSKFVMFHLDHRLGGATGMQSLAAGRTAADALVASINN